MSKGGKNHASNLTAMHESKNTSFARKKDGSMKSEISKRERKK
jgi:hypothetical protein